jgi:hypothetical protein
LDDVAQLDIEEAVGLKRLGIHKRFLVELEGGERPEGGTGQFGWRPSAFDQHRRVRDVQRRDQELRERCGARPAHHEEFGLVRDEECMIMGEEVPGLKAQIRE